MTILNNPRHLALVKRLGKALRADKGTRTAAFFLVIDRESGEALLHLDEVAEPEVFKNPRLIARRLKRYRALKPSTYDAFFAEPRRLVSLAGTVTADSGGSKLIFTRTVRTGKAKKGDVVPALRLFRFLKPELGKAPETAATEPTEKETEQLVTVAREMFGTSPPSGELVLEGFYAHLGSVDALEDTLEAVASRLDEEDDPKLRKVLAALQEAYDELDAWDPELGVVGVQGGLEELLSASEIDAAVRRILASSLASIREAWAEVVRAVEQVLEQVLPRLGETSGLPGAWAGATSTKDLERVVLGPRLQAAHHALTEVAPDAAWNLKVLDQVRSELARARDADPQDAAATLDATLGTDVAVRVRQGLAAAVEGIVSLRARLR